jgi:hypothetical protein
MGTPIEQHITQVHADSRTWESGRPFEFVFIDGGHDFETLASDTRLALSHGAQSVFWHDYKNPDYPHLSAFLEDLPIDGFHIEDTGLVGWFHDPTNRP